MPRICKVCQTEFQYASELAEHLKLSSCSNHVTPISCPYCERKDFVDEEGLNRHLSRNRKCSRADFEATDKLSILGPDTSYRNSSSGLNKVVSTVGPGIIPGDEHGISSQEGNLVNFVNSFDVHKLHQINTSLFPDQQGKATTFYATSVIKDPNGKLHKEITAVTIQRDLDDRQDVHGNEDVPPDHNINTLSFLPSSFPALEDNADNNPSDSGEESHYHEEFEAGGYSSGEESEGNEDGLSLPGNANPAVEDQHEGGTVGPTQNNMHTCDQA